MGGGGGSGLDGGSGAEPEPRQSDPRSLLFLSTELCRLPV